jgi:C-terminal processing protease CtpA/Prc
MTIVLKILFCFLIISGYACKSESIKENTFFQDSVYKVNGSGIESKMIDSFSLIRLKKIGLVWGFLKYHHPNITAKKINWDNVLFKLLKESLSITKDDEFENYLEAIVDMLGKVDRCSECNQDQNELIKGTFLETMIIKSSLKRKLINIRTNYVYALNNRYINLETPVGNPQFTNEFTYDGIAFPDVGIRLLALFRYWNAIEYFYPYKIFLKNWNDVLEESILNFIDSKNSVEYINACMRLVAGIEDTHANVFGSRSIDSAKGVYMIPVEVVFLDKKLIVVKVFNKKIASKIHVGDIIVSIDSTQVEECIKEKLQYVSASNYETKLKVLFSPSGSGLRSNKKKVIIAVKRGKQIFLINCSTIPIESIPVPNWWNQANLSIGFTIIGKDIGYINVGKLSDSDFPKIMEEFKNVKGIIFDFRVYPSVFMPFQYGDWLNCRYTPFATIEKISKNYPGALSVKKPVSIIPDFTSSNKYNGKVIIIVNNSTISQGEYTVMALQNRSNTSVIGSQTAGADGDVSLIELPGGIKTLISGLGVYYPNGVATQRSGVKIDSFINNTEKSIVLKRDLQMELALKLIR